MCILKNESAGRATVGRAVSTDGRRSPEEVLNHLERVEAFERSEGDSPLADETVDAVRVLSIHGAKGLEWPIVFVADVARDGESSRSDSLELEVTRGRRGAVVSARVGGASVRWMRAHCKTCRGADDR